MRITLPYLPSTSSGILFPFIARSASSYLFFFTTRDVDTHQNFTENDIHEKKRNP